MRAPADPIEDPGSRGIIKRIFANVSAIYTAVERRCPHQGCPVSFVSKSAGFTCPCHRSAFDATGKVTRGPATSGLTTIAVAEQGGKIVRS